MSTQIRVDMYQNDHLLRRFSESFKLTNCNLTIYNAVGVEVLTTKVTQQLTTLQTGQLHTGIYFYKLVDKNKIIQSGNLISQNR